MDIKYFALSDCIHDLVAPAAAFVAIVCAFTNGVPWRRLGGVKADHSSRDCRAGCQAEEPQAEASEPEAKTLRSTRRAGDVPDCESRSGSKYSWLDFLL